MSGFGRSCGGSETDLLCVEVSAMGPSVLPRASRDGRQESPPACARVLLSSADQAQEEFLSSLLLKTDTYRPRQASLKCMENSGFLAMREAVVNWFANVSVSYDFANETVVAALSNFDRYVSITLEPVNNHLLLQLAAYVALLVASKMSETCPLRMSSLANLTGRMFTPLQVQKCEMDMISKLHFRLAPPSADETLHCLSSLLRTSWISSVPVADVLSTSACYLKKARARTCWFRHSPYTLAVAALATAYNSLSLGYLKCRLLQECDDRARTVTGRGLDVHGVAACVEVMTIDERVAAIGAAAAAAAARARRGSMDSPVCNASVATNGWGSPTGVEQGAELLQETTFSVVGNTPLTGEFSPPSPKALSPQKVRNFPRANTGHVQACPAQRALPPGPTVLPHQANRKRGFQQSFGSCFMPCRRRSSLNGGVIRRGEEYPIDSEIQIQGEEEGGSSEKIDCMF